MSSIAATPALVPQQGACPAAYRPRNSRATSLYQLLDAHKRAAIFSQLLQDRILADVPHAQWVFSIPKMLRPYFLFHRQLLGELARLAYETVREMMLVNSQHSKQTGADGAPPPRRSLSRRWAQLIDYRARGPHPHAHTLRRLCACGCAEGSYRIYEVDPLSCTRCGAPMKILAFITESAVIRKILNHLDLNLTRTRAPPEPNVH